eukprot:scaffold1534_cov267-Pinguiococcus_pyrenoidosus.AAC.13
MACLCSEASSATLAAHARDQLRPGVQVQLSLGKFIPASCCVGGGGPIATEFRAVAPFELRANSAVDSPANGRRVDCQGPFPEVVLPNWGSFNSFPKFHSEFRVSSGCFAG